MKDMRESKVFEREGTTDVPCTHQQRCGQQWWEETSRLNTCSWFYPLRFVNYLSYLEIEWASRIVQDLTWKEVSV